MLISMPHGTSTIFGAFQAILPLPCKRTNSRPHRLNYRVTKSSPAKSFVLKLPRVLLQRSKAAHAVRVGRSKQRAIKGFIPVPRREQVGSPLALRCHQNK
jgi:hypothetical protein